MQFFKSSVGLYIGPKTVQVAQLNIIAGRVHLTNFVHVDIFEDEQKFPATEQENLILNAVRKAVHKSKIDLKKINTVLMPGMVLLRYFQMPRISPEEMEEAVKFEAKKYIPFRLEEAVTGFYILKDDVESKKMGILSLVTREESIKNHLEMLKKADISPVSIETASFAIIRLLEHSGEIDKQKSNVVLYIYAQRMNIIILKNGVPYFVRDISLAKKEEWIDDETAELLMAKGLSRIDSRTVVLENLISELRISFEYYKKELGREDISKIILCGETESFDEVSSSESKDNKEQSETCYLASYLQQKLEIPVSLIHPLKNIQSPKLKPLPYTFPMLAVTIGAGLKGLYRSTVEIDLFKARRAPSIKKRIFLNKMLLIEIAVLVVTLLLTYLVSSILVTREKNLLEKEKQRSPKFIDLSHFDVAQLNDGAREIESRMEIYKKFVKKRLYLTEKLNVIPKLMSEGLWLTELTYENSVGETSSETKIIVSGNVFLEKKGLEVEVINEFSEKLKNDEKFFAGLKTIKTGSVSRANYSGEQVMSFRLNCSSSAQETE